MSFVGVEWAELISDNMGRNNFRPTDLSGGLAVGLGRDGDVYLLNVRMAEMRRLTDDEARQNEAVISGKYVAWTDRSRLAVAHDNGDPNNPRVSYPDDIFLLDLETDEIRRITDEPAERRNPDIDGRRLVWQDNRNELEEHETHHDIYAYDIELDREIPIEVAPGAQRWPVIDGDRVIWSDNRSSPYMGTRKAECARCPEVRLDIYLYDFTTGERRVVVVSGAVNSRSADIHGDQVVWRGYDEEGRGTVYLHDLSTGRNRTITTPLESLRRNPPPFVSEDYVVWRVSWPCGDADNAPEGTGLYIYDIGSGETRRITDYIEPEVRFEDRTLIAREMCITSDHVVYAVFLD